MHTIEIKPLQPRHNRPMPHTRRFALLIWAMTLMAGFWGTARAEVFDEYQVKAVFLYNLTNFISWPETQDLPDNAQFTICLLGCDSLAHYLDQVVSGETIKGLNIRILHLSNAEQLQANACDMLFVCADHMALWPQIRAHARGNGILTVSDVDGFGARGGMVTLLTAGRKIRIEINVQEAKANGFAISAKLLKLSQIVSGGKDQ